MGLHSVTAISLAAGLAACASGAGRQGPAYPGDVAGAPSIEALPSLDVPDALLSMQMKRARLLTAESLALQVPIAVDTHASALASWSDSALKGWLKEKHARAEAARKELDRAAVVSHRERILAGALVGLVYEDMARALLSVPAPSELDDEPEVRKVFGEVLRAQASPYLVHARLAYQACAANAQGLAPMGHWSSFCDGRRDELPEVPPSDVTTVAVMTSP